MPYPVNGSDTSFNTELIRQLWLNNDFYGGIFSLQQKSKNTQLTFGGAITHYNGVHYGKIIWAEKGLTGPAKWYDVQAYKNDLNLYGKWQQDLSKVFQLFTDLQFRRVNYHLNGFE